MTRPGPNHQDMVIRMPKDMHAALADRAAEEDLSMAQVVRRAVRRYLALTSPRRGEG